MKLEKEGLVVTPLTEQKTGLWDMAFIWFCANVAVPRLMIGGSLAELGFGKMMLTLLVGNIVVFLPLLALGVIGYNVRIPTMAATRMTFGVRGSYLPSVTNGIQLLGWGANVTVICGSSINSIVKAMTGFENLTLWIIVTGLVSLSSPPTACAPSPGCSAFPFRCWPSSPLFPPSSSSRITAGAASPTTPPLPPWACWPVWISSPVMPLHGAPWFAITTGMP